MALGKNIAVKEGAESASEVGQKPEEGTSTVASETGSVLKEKEEKETETVVSQSQYCVFASGNEEYAIPIDVVKEVVKYKEPAPIPQMPDYIIGMSNIRGNIYGILDIDMFFQTQSFGQEHKYLIVIDHPEYKMAIRIYNVPNSMIVLDDQIEQLNSASSKSVIGQKYLKGIIKKDQRMIVLFDILGMISSDKFTDLSSQ